MRKRGREGKSAATLSRLWLTVDKVIAVLFQTLESDTRRCQHPRAKGGFILSALVGVATHIKDSPDAKTQLTTMAQVVSA